MTDRTCLITGAGRGIGLATALRFARAGCRVAIAARNEHELATAAAKISAAGGECLPVAADVTASAAVQNLIDSVMRRFGRIDVLVNNAGWGGSCALEEISDEDFHRTTSVNIDGVFYMTRGVWPVMRAQRRGVIVNVSSMASIDPFPNFSVYAGTKAWVNMFTKATAEEGRALGIRVFAVAPGAVETALLRAVAPDFPAGGALDPDDVAGVIESVADERMTHATGQVVFVRK